MAASDPATEVSTPTGVLAGTASFFWNGTAWAALGSGSSGSSGGIGVSGNVGGFTSRVTATLSRPADATQYSIGDIIANSLTAGSVVPLTFTAARTEAGSGRITGARAVVAAASGTIVLPAFDLILFRNETNIPFAAGGYPADNAALNVTAAAMRELVCFISFSATGWRNQAGGLTAAGPAIYQTASLTTRPYAPFKLTAGTAILGILQAQNTWNPGAVVNQLDFALDVDQD